LSPYTLPDEELVVVHGPELGGPGGAYRAFGATLKGLRKTSVMQAFEIHCRGVISTDKMPGMAPLG